MSEPGSAVAQAKGFPAAVGRPAAIHGESVAVDKSTGLIVCEERNRSRNVIRRC